MRELMMCVLALAVSLYLFVSFGSIILKCMKQRFRLTVALLLGFFGYFALFQIVYLPCMLLQIRLSVLSGLWMAVCAAIGIFALVWCRLNWGGAWCMGIRSVRKHKWGSFLLFAAAMLALFELYYMVRYGYNGYDTQYYIGTVNTSVYTDSMFRYDGVTGQMEQSIQFRYALSGFYTNAAIFCQVFRVVPALCMRYMVGTICWLLANTVLFELGRTCFTKKKLENGCWTVILGIGLNFFFRTMYTTSEFLLLRSYEAKAICSNVILPSVLLACIWVWKGRDGRKWWVYLGLITASANTISMSSILTVPVAATVFLAGRMLSEKGARRVGSYLLCMLPCILYIGVYLLARMNILIIRVR